MRKSFLIILITLAISCVSALGFYIRPVSAIIWIEGHITSDTTWTPIDTYRVINNTYVDPGATLTILPDVHVQFADGFALIVQGSLNATGTYANPIVFTSSRVSPTPGVWNGIQFSGNSSEKLLLSHVNIAYAINGVTIASFTPTVVEKSLFSNNSESAIQIAGGNTQIKENGVTNNKNGIVFCTNLYPNLTWSNIAILNNTIFHNKENGVYLTEPYAYTPKFNNISISGNEAWFNGMNGISVYIPAIVNHLRISFNSVMSNGQDGITVSTGGGSPAGMHDIQISTNIVYANGQNGIRLYNYVWGNGDRILIEDNRIASNGADGINSYGIISPNDLLIRGNAVSWNSKRGCYMTSAGNLTRNSIAYNLYGIEWGYGGGGGYANYNDIYSNKYGLNVTYPGNTVNANHNFWGDSSGPYHLSLNPEGKGNPVDGDGANLSFIPFLTANQSKINQRPVAALSVDKKTPSVNETVTFSATSSTDDGRIDYYFFDFGDGRNSSWTSLPVVTHAYSHNGTYYATVTVMDDYGFTSNNTQQIKAQIIVVPEFPILLILPLFMMATLLAVIVYRKKRISTG